MTNRRTEERCVVWTDGLPAWQQQNTGTISRRAKRVDDVCLIDIYKACWPLAIEKHHGYTNDL